MAQDISKVINLGPCQIMSGAVDLGHTDEAGAKVSATISVVKAMVGKFGKTPVAQVSNGIEVKVEFNLIQTTLGGNLASILPGATKVTNLAGDSKLTFGSISGSVLTPFALTLTPFKAANTPGLNFNLPVAVSNGSFELVYSGDMFQIWKCSVEGMVNEAGGTDGNYLFSIGDSSITADAIAPTVTAFNPASAATGVNVASSMVWTVSKDLDGNTVTAASVLLFKDPSVTPSTKVAGTVSLINAGASTLIRFTPTAPLTAATKYLALLDGSILGKNGVVLAFTDTVFTTA